MAGHGSTSFYCTLACAVLLVLCLEGITRADPIPTVPEDTSLDYLYRFGYLGRKNTPGNSIAEQIDVSQAVADFQSMAGINVTGVLDSATLEAMRWDRCGNKDETDTSRRKKRYALAGSKWNKNDLTYRITKYTSDLKKADVDSIIQKAFDYWADVTPLTFTPKATGSIDIEIKFAVGSHGDGDPFDGRGGVLAHAFFPKYGGDAHFDDAEVFTIRSKSGINLLQVAAHEFGHSLGLSHSRIRSALMAPFYRGYNPSFKLHSDDIAGIQSIYGKPVVKSTTTTTTTTTTTSPTIVPSTITTSAATTTTQTQATTTTGATSGSPDFCDGKIDAVILSKKKTFMFKGDYYALVVNLRIAATYPRKIADDWEGVPGNLDAAITWSNSRFTYLFKGENYWVFDDQRKIGGPMAISATFLGLPSNIDAAFQWTNRRIYIFKGVNYYRLSACGNGVDRGYPQPIRRWSGLSSAVDAVFRWSNGRTYFTYFFQGDKFLRFSGSRVDGGYPKDTAPIWLSCSRATRKKRDASVSLSELLLNEDNKIDDAGESIDDAWESEVKRQEGGPGSQDSHPMGNDALDHENPTEHNRNSSWALTHGNDNFV